MTVLVARLAPSSQPRAYLPVAETLRVAGEAAGSRGVWQPSRDHKQRPLVALNSQE